VDTSGRQEISFMLVAMVNQAICHPRWGPTLKISLLMSIPLTALVVVVILTAPALPWILGGSLVTLGSRALVRSRRSATRCPHGG
jgi:hypothetical protein